MKSKDIAVVLGTRPEIIKLAGVITALGERARVIHTGQHYDRSMSGQFLDDFGIGDPDVVLTGVGGQDRSTQISTALSALAQEFRMNPPKVVIVQGDTNAVSAGAQAANYAGIPVVHVEAGLRSYDRAMPEELNRLVVGALADMHCAATPLNEANLLSEGIDQNRIVVTGNTIVEATQASLTMPISATGAQLMSSIPDRYVLATIHRPENTDTPEALERILRGLSTINAPVVFPAHPRTRAAITRFGLERYLHDITIVNALGHSDFLKLAASAVLLVSDSGGIQEECTVLKRPLLVIRRSTERPESIDAGFARLVTPEMDIAAEANNVLVDIHLNKLLAATSSPYGTGDASTTIARIATKIADGKSPQEVSAELISTPVLV